MATGVTGQKITIAKRALGVYQKQLGYVSHIGVLQLSTRDTQKRRANSFTEVEIQIGYDLLGTALRGGSVGRGLTSNPNFLSLYRKFAKMKTLISS